MEPILERFPKLRWDIMACPAGFGIPEGDYCAAEGVGTIP